LHRRLQSELQQTWARFNDKQTRSVAQLMTEQPGPSAAEVIDEDRLVLDFDTSAGRFVVGPSPSPSPTPPRAAAGAALAVLGPSRPLEAPAAVDAGAGMASDSADEESESGVLIIDTEQAGRSNEIVAWRDQWPRKSDEERLERDRLRQEVYVLRSELARRSAEVELLRKSAERAVAIRAERDRLNQDRVALGREATRLHSQLIAVQAALVDVEAELDDCRDRARAEREQWHHQRQELIQEVQRLLSEQQRRLAAERQVWIEHEQGQEPLAVPESEPVMSL
jgi:hypothetical protein